MSNQFISPFTYFVNPSTGKPIGNGLLYIGEPDADPQDFPVQVYVVQQDSVNLPISQPITLSAGGVAIYNGSPVQLKYDGVFVSVKTTTSNGSLIYYTPRCEALLTASELEDPDSQFVIGGKTVEDIIKQLDVYTTVEENGGVQEALDTGLPVFLKADTDYQIDETLIIPEKALMFGPKSARLISNVNGYMAEAGSRVTLAGFSARGELPNARGLLIKTGTALQTTSNLEFVFTKEALDFETLGGSDFSSVSDTWVTLTPSLYAVRVATTASTEAAATPRKFINPAFGGNPGIDWGSCNDSFLTGCYMFGMKMADNSSKIMVNNVRMGAGVGGPNLEIRGINHAFTNCVPATPVDVYAIDSRIDMGVVGNWAVNDLGAGNSIDYKNRVYTPVFSTDGVTQPDLTDSALFCSYQREGNTVRVSGQLTLSATATMGDGNVFMSLPPNSQGAILGIDQTCQGSLQKIGPRPSYTALPVVVGDRTKVSFSYTDTSGTAILEEFLGSDIVGNKFILTAKAPTFIPDLDNAIDVYHYDDATDLTGRIWKSIGTKTFGITLLAGDVIEITLSFAPAADDYIIVELEQAALRGMQSAPIEQWPAGTVLRWAFSYNCK